MNAVRHLHLPARRGRAVLAVAALAVGLVVGLPTAAAAACTVSRTATSAVELGGNIASQPGVAIVVSHAATGVTSPTWTASGLPGGVSFNGATGSISGAASEGEYVVTVTATATDGTTCSRSFTWFVNDSYTGTITPELPPEQIPSQQPSTPSALPEGAPASQSEGVLAFTGGDVAGMVVVALGAVGLGLLLVWSQRRRRADLPTT
jgi:hypothetical protein